jgi:selenium metabolism protein YedF
MQEIVLIDTRGLSCPQPVLETKRVIEGSGGHEFKVLVDNVISRENVSRFARNQGFAVEVRDNGASVYELNLKRSTGGSLPEAPEDLLPCAVPQTGVQVRNVVFIGHHGMGRGDEELGQRLMRGFLRTWVDSAPKPWRMIFINSGVKLTTLDDEAVEAIALLEEHGVEILSCGTCLQHFGLEEKLRVGRVTTMYEVIESMNQATKVLSPA